MMKPNPNTYETMLNDGQKVERPKLFEPALLHFSNAYRFGDPVFQNPEISRAWSKARLQILDYLLQLIADSRWRDHLVLRGSLLLKAWLGDAAREPGDIDWVFRPASLGVDDKLAKEFFISLTHMVSAYPYVGNAVIEVGNISIDDIWTYERSPGRRMIFPWQVEGLPVGYIQMDVAFGEELLAAPIQVTIPLTEGESPTVRAAGKELSLAWKLLWLETDMHPQGKDLYDAVLLAEQTYLPLDLLYRVLRAGGRPDAELKPGFPLAWEIDWANFKLEYPEVEGKAKEWQTRLAHALAPTFTIAR